MSDLISRSALIEAITDVEVAWDMDGNYTTYDATTIVDIIQEQPTVEAKPVVHGEWIEEWDREHFFSSCICSNCGKGTCRDSLMKWVKGAFCQNCGADMRGKKNE